MESSEEGDAPTDTGKQCLQIVDQVGSTLVSGQVGSAKTKPHGSHFSLMGRQHQVGIAAGHQMDAVAYVEQTFHSFVMPNAVRSGRPAMRRRARGDETTESRNPTGLFDMG